MNPWRHKWHSSESVKFRTEECNFCTSTWNFKIEAKHKTTTTTLGTQLLGVILQGTSHVVQLLSTKLKQQVTKNQVGTTFNAIRSKGIKSYLQFWFQSRLDLHPIKVKLNCVEVGSKKCAFEFQASFSFSSCSARTCQVAVRPFVVAVHICITRSKPALVGFETPAVATCHNWLFLVACLQAKFCRST